MSGPPTVFVLNGPNLDRLGTREPEIYGRTTLAELEDRIRTRAKELGLAAEFYQSNDEESFVEAVRTAPARGANAILINPAALSHFSYPLRDALAETGLPIVEVHISNIHAREQYRRLSLISPVARGVVCGLGVSGYILALDAMAEILAARGTAQAKPAPARRRKG